MKTKKPDESKGAPEFNCARCDDEIDDVAVITFGAKAGPKIDLAPAAGKIIAIHLLQAKRTVSALVPMRDSPAVKDGHDLIFMVCSGGCGQALSNALKNDWELWGAAIE